MQIRTVHPFPARMAPELALRSMQALPKGSTVLDPMSGSGTVLRQAMELGHHAIGFDLDPLAVLMSRVWTSPIDLKTYDQELVAILAESDGIDLRRYRPSWQDAETVEFTKYWFGHEQRRGLARIAIALSRRREARLGDPRRRVIDALQVALSRIIVTKEQCASLARDTSHSRPHRVAEASDYDVRGGFLRSAQQLARRINEHPSTNAAQVDLGDARATGIQNHSVDAIMTSPPYLNAIDYMRGHRMSLVWLGYSLPQLRGIRSVSVGAERAADSDHSTSTKEVINAMCNVESLAGRHQKMVARYALDLQRMMLEANRVLKRTGIATYVVGNSCLKDTFIENSKGVQRAAELAGMKLVDLKERELPSSSRYLPMTATGSLSKRMRTETVLTFTPLLKAERRKNGQLI